MQKPNGISLLAKLSSFSDVFGSSLEVTDFPVFVQVDFVRVGLWISTSIEYVWSLSCQTGSMLVYQSKRTSSQLKCSSLYCGKCSYWQNRDIGSHNVIVCLLIAFVFPFDAFNSNQFCLNVFTWTSKRVKAHLRAIEGWKKMYNFSLFLVLAKTTFHYIIPYKVLDNVYDEQIALVLDGI